MTTFAAPTSTQDIATAKEKFGNAMIAVLALRQARSSDFSYTLSGYGINIVQEGTNYSAKAEARDPYLPSPTKFSDLSESAQTRLLAQELQTLLQQAYCLFQGQQYNGVEVKDLTPHLEAMGLPVPTQVTAITGTVYNAEGKPVPVSLNVTGVMTHDEAAKALADAGHDHPSTAFARAAFGDRVVETSLPGKTTSVRASTTWVWPAVEDIKVEGAAEGDNGS